MQSRRFGTFTSYGIHLDKSLSINAFSVHNESILYVANAYQIFNNICSCFIHGNIFFGNEFCTEPKNKLSDIVIFEHGKCYNFSVYLGVK